MSYRVYISFDAGTNKAELIIQKPKIKTTLDKGVDGRFCYRDKLSEIKITQRNNPTEYATLLHYFNTRAHYVDKVNIYVYNGNSTTGTLKLTSFFYISDGASDKQNGSYTVTPETDDDYVDFDRGGDVTYRMGADDYNLCYNASLSMQLYNGTASVPNNTDGYQSFASSLGVVTICVKSSGTVLQYFYQNAGSLDSGVPVTVTISGYTLSSGTNPSMKLVSNLASQTSASNNVTITGNGTYILTTTTSGTLYLSIYTLPANLADYVMTIAVSYIANRTKSLTDIKVKLLHDALNTLIYNNALYLNTGHEVVSTFLWNDALPSTGKPPTINTYISANPTHNYVTSAVNKLNYLCIAYRFAFTGASGKDEIKFKEFMSSLSNLLNVYWYIDDDGKFRIEHYYWFEDLRSTGIDITTATYAQFKPEVDMKKFQINKGDLYDREHWEISYNQMYGTGLANGLDFVGVDIKYNIFASLSQILERRVTTFSTDIEYLSTLSGDIDGFALIQCSFGYTGHYVEVNEIGVLSSTSHRNGHLSLANLHDAYWKRGRIYDTGYMNNSPITFTSVAPIIRQQVKFATTSDIDPYGYITTSQGDGIISESERDLQSDFITQEILL